MSLRIESAGPVPEETARVARAAFPKGNVYMQMRDVLGVIYDDETFSPLFAVRGRPAECPWRLALVTVMQFAEGLSDRQAAEAVRARIDWKYALGLVLDDAGFHYSVLCEFRARLLDGSLDHLLLEALLAACRTHGLLRRRGRQRTDATHVLGVLRLLNRLEQVAETMRAALDALADAAPDWLLAHTPPEWFERYGRRVEEYRLPQGREAREAFARQVGADGMRLLTDLAAPEAPPPLRDLQPSRFCGARGSNGISSGRDRSGCASPRTSQLLPSRLCRPTKPRRATPPSARRAGLGTRSTSPRPATTTCPTLSPTSVRPSRQRRTWTSSSRSKSASRRGSSRQLSTSWTPATCGPATSSPVSGSIKSTSSARCTTTASGKPKTPMASTWRNSRLTGKPAS